MPKKHTAKTFRSVLVAVLGELSGYSANYPVAMQDVIATVLSRMGMEAEDLGEKHGKLETHRLIGLAFRGAKGLANPLTTSPSKGQWALTQRGVEQARQSLGPRTPSVTFILDEKEALQPEESPVDTRHVYDVDPYIRSLAIAQTPCFGYLYDRRHPTCQTCVLASYCQEKFWVRCAIEHEGPQFAVSAPAACVTETAQVFDFALSEEELSTEVDELVDEEVVLTEDQAKRATKITISKTMACQKCSKQIPKGIKVMYIAPFGVFHETPCFRELRRVK